MKKNKLYINDWLEFKPYEIEDSTDLHYLKIANEIYQVILQKEFAYLNIYLEEKQKKELSCFLTCYFEDIISETNFWFAFKDKHREMYGKTLPFFSTKKEEYFDDEFNLEDVALLIWYFINIVDEDYFTSPYNDIFLEIAEGCMKVFEKHYEYAPENIKLKKYFSLNEYDEANGLYHVRGFMQKIIYESYLFKIDILKRKIKEYYEFLSRREEEDYDLTPFLSEIEETYTFNKKTTLLALQAKEWTANILGKNHFLHNDILKISKKIQGHFLYKKENENSIFLEHIASNMLFEVTKKSLDNYKDFQGNDIIIIGLVRWKNEWWFSGTYTTIPFDADLILDIKDSISARASVNFLQDKKAVAESMKLLEEAFLKFNNNSLIRVVEERKVKNFTDDFMEFYHSTLNLSESEKKEANANVRKDGFFGGESDNSFKKIEEGEALTVIFYNPKGGLEIYYEIENAFLITDPSLDIEIKEEITQLLMLDEYSTELVHYFLDKNISKIKMLQVSPFAEYIDNLDFLLRFWKIDNYETEPKQTLI